MAAFISGLLEANEPGATYMGTVYDRFLTLRHPTGKILTIFDMHAISTELLSGTTCELMVRATLWRSLRYHRNPTSAPRTTVWVGEVASLDWKPPKDACYQFVNPELFATEWVIVTTPLGQLLMSPEEIGQTLDVGGVLEWEGERLDLLAVI